MKTNMVLEPQEESQAQERPLEDELRPIEHYRFIARCSIAPDSMTACSE
jgi:hypothetical protein